jgi:hypothetical protein
MDKKEAVIRAAQLIINLKKEIKMSFSILSILMIAIFVLCMAVEVYRSISNGAKRSLVSLGSLLLSLILSFLICPLVAAVSSKAAFSYIRSLPEYSSILDDLPFMVTAGEPIIAMLVAIVLFVFIFFGVRAATGKIVARIYKKKIHKNLDELEDDAEDDSWVKRHDRLISVVLGCIAGFVITVTVTSPIMGVLNTTQDFIDFARNSSETAFDDRESKKMIKAIEVYTKDAPGNVFYHMGGRLVFRGYACTFRKGERIDLVREIDVLEEASENLMMLKPAMEGESRITKKHLDSIDGLCKNVKEMKIGRILLATYVPMGTQAWLEGNMIFGIEKPHINEIIDPTFNEVLRVCATSDETNIQQNTITMLRVYGIFLDSEILEISDDDDFDDILEFIEESRIIDRLSAELSLNPYMANVRKCVESMVVDVIADQLYTVEFGQVAYQELMESLAGSINTVNGKGYSTDEERNAAMASLAQQYLRDYGYDVSEETASYTAQLMMDSLGYTGQTVLAEDVHKFFGGYTN